MSRSLTSNGSSLSCSDADYNEAWQKFVNKRRETRRALGGAHVPPTKVFRQLSASVNKTIIKPCVAVVVGRKTILKPCLAAATNTYTSDFPDAKFLIR